MNLFFFMVVEFYPLMSLFKILSSFSFLFSVKHGNALRW